jgi:phosphoribosylglycinamide formyltransferase-1
LSPDIADGGFLKRIVVLISGRGSNMRSLLEARLPASFEAVISNVPSAAGLAIARQHGIATAVVDHKAYATREAFDAALRNEIDRYRPDLVVLAGFMRVLTEDTVRHYAGRMLNIHPSLLPAFPGLHTHRAALDAGVRVHGCTVHFVTPQLDHGPIIVQAAVPVLDGDTEAALAARVLAEEHHVYAQAVRWFCDDRLRITADGKVQIAGVPAAAGALHSPPPEAERL